MKDKYCKILGSNKIYVIENIDGETIRLRNGNTIVTTNMSKIQIVSEEHLNKNIRGSYSVEISSSDIPNEIMLRHKYKDEAIAELDKYIDQAVVAKLGRVRVIHGKHGGILRKAVHEYLENHPNVKEFHIADYAEGGLGVTIVVLGRK